MPPLTIRDWYIGCALQGLLAHPCEDEITGDDMMPLSEAEALGLHYGDIVGRAIEIGSACMQLRKERSEEN